ncbi:uncharacterized protein Z520_08211 [Fonsecaea multimorphosa CBS 102226]|uniref:Prion-inhibition and propagation HeLo domain-containing protein n=1 Tax=Fonsecaea multimorphosa CBS 102226 TaxID=1442371 RepID=A0A0D2IFX1_9EURO|nr:uncharacterized protein Z520_08211 [Fonsecaea multimorphosa CBS 102226]KIX95956.1 hypothetical protein Z520_08211 [Fonsecaea multimorphosa CBS 102226]OAL21727.1 hypothetical protein AYO22_07669 [Fonsecaea multimorphosa]
METAAASLVVENVASARDLTECLKRCNSMTTLPVGAGRPHHVHEFEMAYIKLHFLKSWLGAVGVTVYATAAASPGDQRAALRSQWNSQKEVVSARLDGIRGLLRDPTKLREQYGFEVAVPASREVEDETMQAIEPASPARTSSAASSSQPPRSSPAAAWSLPERHKVVSARLAQLDHYVALLEALLQQLDTANEARQVVEMIQRANRAFPDAANLDVLLEASTPTNSHSFPAATTDGATGPPGASAQLRLASHSYRRNRLKEQAQAILGDIGFTDENAARSDYRENELIGSAQAVLGNVDGAFASTFFRKAAADLETS